MTATRAPPVSLSDRPQAADWRPKVVLVGKGGVGKTSLLNQMLHERFTPDRQATIGVQVNGFPTDFGHVTGWDVGGQMKASLLNNQYFRGASAFIIVGAIDDADSVHMMSEWMHEIKSIWKLHFPEEMQGVGEDEMPKPTFAVYNKIDNCPPGREQELDELTRRPEALACTGAFLTTAKRHDTVRVVFNAVAKYCYENCRRPAPPPAITPKPQSRSCCPGGSKKPPLKQQKKPR